MAKKKTQKDLAKAYEAKHRKNLSICQKQIAEIYRKAAQEAASISSLIHDFDTEDVFTFAANPITHQRAASFLEGFRKNLTAAIVNGVRSEWTLANNKNNELCNQVFGDNIGALSEAQYSRYYSTNQKALDAFLERKTGGLNLSERVWKYADEFKKEIEAGIDIGLRDGLPVSEMATSLKQFLRHPDKLFRRVRDEHGELQLSKAAEAFHPGQGVYRSSYKNARRLAVTEGNIAFHTADYLRMQEMDFIVGQHVILSNNHTCLGVKGTFHDICDELSGVDENDPRGRYPKDFKFTGWHPHCRCGMIAILKTDEEIAEDTRKILAGEPLDGESVNRVSDVPEEFKEWMEDNEGRLEKAKSLPYFISDNRAYCSDTFKSQTYGERGINLFDAKQSVPLRFESEEAKRINDLSFSVAQLSSFSKIENFGFDRGPMMTTAQADKGRVNPGFIAGTPTGQNCATCVQAYALRRMGFNVTAKPLTPGSRQESLSYFNAHYPWRNADGSRVSVETFEGWRRGKKLPSMGAKEYKQFFEIMCKEPGIYITQYSGSRNGHVTIIERRKDRKLVRVEPQSYSILLGAERSVDSLCNIISKQKSQHKLAGVFRVDDKIFDIDTYASILGKVGK